MQEKNIYTNAEAYRNTLILEFYGLEEYIKNAKTTADYIDLIRRASGLSETMARVLNALAKANETLKPIDNKTMSWIKKI